MTKTFGAVLAGVILLTASVVSAQSLYLYPYAAGASESYYPGEYGSSYQNSYDYAYENPYAYAYEDCDYYSNNSWYGYDDYGCGSTYDDGSYGWGGGYGYDDCSWYGYCDGGNGDWQYDPCYPYPVSGNCDGYGGGWGYDPCYPYPVSGYCGGNGGGYYFDWCQYYPWYCNPDPGYGSNLSITNVSGPNSLRVGELGTWSITTTAPSNTQLSVSVRWGDEQYGYGADAYASPRVSQQNTFTHTYNRAGNYTVVFTVSDNQGRSDTATVSVVVQGASQGSADFSASPMSGVAPLTVTFRSVLRDDPQQYLINFGDGETGRYQQCSFSDPMQCSLQHTYRRAGTYTAQLIQSICPNTAVGCMAPEMIVASIQITVTGDPYCWYDQWGGYVCQ